mmetsp:Transcript_87638/g.220515  ORF Transcript_87638/g.220515 Transcript_87638/m.220515 type:complete len:208 (+) Transcript_87638:478-1101(+)
MLQHVGLWPSLDCDTLSPKPQMLILGTFQALQTRLRSPRPMDKLHRIGLAANRDASALVKRPELSELAHVLMRPREYHGNIRHATVWPNLKRCFLEAIQAPVVQGKPVLLGVVHLLTRLGVNLGFAVLIPELAVPTDDLDRGEGRLQSPRGTAMLLLLLNSGTDRLHLRHCVRHPPSVPEQVPHLHLGETDLERVQAADSRGQGLQL